MIHHCSFADNVLSLHNSIKEEEEEEEVWN